MTNASGQPMHQYVQTLQRMQPFTVYELVGVDELKPYMLIEGATLIPALVITEFDLGGQVERSSAEVGWWSRLAAQCERVKEVKERQYAVWKSQFRLDNATKVLESTGKKPTAAQLEDMYRTAPEYDSINRTLEEVREALRACEGVVAAFKAKRENLTKMIWRGQDGAMKGLQI